MQTSYGFNAAAGMPGMLADLGNNDVLTRVNPAVVHPGKIVVRGTDPDAECKSPAVSGDVAKALGLALLDQAMENGAEGFPAKSSVPILAKGRAFVKVEEAVTPDSTVFVRFAAKRQIIAIVFSADLVTSNKVNLKVNGTSIAEVTFDTDHATTMAALAAEVLKIRGVASATVGGASNRTLTVGFDKDFDISAITNVAVTAGASQATATVTETQAQIHSREIGSLRASADNDENSAATAASLTGIKFRSSAAAAALAILELAL